MLLDLLMHWIIFGLFLNDFKELIIVVARSDILRKILLLVKALSSARALSCLYFACIVFLFLACFILFCNSFVFKVITLSPSKGFNS